MEAKASKHASKCEHACARARSLLATLPGGGPAEDGSELRSHACVVAKVETRGETTHTRTDLAQTYYTTRESSSLKST